MLPDTIDYHIAWVFPSSDQQAVARRYFDDDIVNHYSSTCRVTYTFGRVEDHDVVVASPASNAEVQSTDYIIKDLLHNVPSIRAGFLVSSDAVAPRAGVARVGDIVVGGTSPNIERGVIYLEAEKIGGEKRVRVTGASRQLPYTVVDAVKKLRSKKGRQDWQKHLSRDSSGFEMLSAANNHDASLPEAPHSFCRKALLGVIASSKDHIRDTTLLKNIIAERRILCFETAAATPNSGPFLVVAGISKYCEDDQSKEETCNAIISYLTCLVHRLKHYELKFEPRMVDLFQYDSLDLESAEFRLLRLQGGHAGLKCQIFNGCFHDETLVPYEALSYCWGNNLLTDQILVNGKKLFVTSNLYVALKNLRFENKDRILWIDGICIDQGNDQERGHQVEHMGDVYRCADQVLIWLGNFNRNYDIAQAFQAMHRFEGSAPGQIWEPERRGLGLLTTGEWLPRESEQRGLELLMNNEWFGRIWIIQEVFHAKRAILGCSEGWINATTFALAPSLLQVPPSNQCQAIIDIMPGPSRTFSWWNQKPNLSTLLWKFRDSQATDSRDRVFALLDISSDKPFKSDYSKTDEAVARDLMAYICKDNVSSNPRKALKIVNLQQMIPSLLYLGLDQFTPCGTPIDVTERFVRRHNKQVFLSEAAVAYLWYIRSPLQELLMNESSIVHVVQGQISEWRIPRSIEPLATYLGRYTTWQEILRALLPWRGNNSEFTSMMLEQDGGQDGIEVTEVLALRAAKSGPNIFERFLDKYGEQVILSRDLINAADYNGLDILELLLYKHYGQIRITDALVVDAIQRGPETVHTLLDRYRDQVKITETAILEAIPTGPERLTLLLQACGERFMISQTVAEAAIKRGFDTFKALLDERGNQVEIGRAIINAALEKGPYTLKLLIDRCGDRITCSDEMIYKAIGRDSNTLEVLLDRYGDHIMISNKMLCQVITQRPNMLELLLDRFGHQISWTDDIVYQVIDQASPSAFKVVLDQYGDQMDVQNIAMSTFYHASEPKKLGLLLDRYGDRIEIPADGLNTLLRNGMVNKMRMLLDRYGARTDVLTALMRVEDKWVFRRYATRTLLVEGQVNVYPWLRVLASAMGDILARRSQLFAMLLAGEVNELLLDPGLLL